MSRAFISYSRRNTNFAERLARKHPRAATIMMAVLNTTYAAIVAHNYRVARQ